VISPSLTPKGALIQGVETRFPWFLLATLLPILAMPFTNLDGNLAERICLPLVGLNLVAQSVRIMPANGAGLALLGSERLYSGLGLVPPSPSGCPSSWGLKPPALWSSWC
jgi:hypothetical protein